MRERLGHNLLLAVRPKFLTLRSAEACTKADGISAGSRNVTETRPTVATETAGSDSFSRAGFLAGFAAGYAWAADSGGATGTGSPDLVSATGRGNGRSAAGFGVPSFSNASACTGLVSRGVWVVRTSE